jgi:hypothetical protein
LAVIDGPLEEGVAVVLEEGSRLGIPIGVEAWQPEGAELGPDAHRQRLAHLVHDNGTVTLATHPSQLLDFIEAAGAVRAWL